MVLTRQVPNDENHALGISQGRGIHPLSNQAGTPLVQGAPYAPAAQAEYANWLYRVSSFVIDVLITAAPLSIARILIVAFGLTNAFGSLSDAGVAIGQLGQAVSLAIFIWNTLIRQGSTGQSFGKWASGTRLISLRTNQPIGVGMAFVRQIFHVLDALPSFLGYLWPLWDSKRQTFADKLVGTVVVRV
jgi:uncharacterized RDD family membrane protein YckC